MSSFATLPSRLAAQWSSSPAASAERQLPELNVNLAVSGVTDPGGAKCKANQDTFFTHCDPGNCVMVLGVFDGHGKEAGRDAALAAKDFFQAHFEAMTQQDYETLEQSPQRVFSDIFRACQSTMKSVLSAVYERRGFSVEEQDGYIVKKISHPASASDKQTTCVRGGTTATVVVILDGGRKILTANVGDSSVALGANGCSAAVRMKLSDVSELREEGPECLSAAAGDDDPSASNKVTDATCSVSPAAVLLLTGDHSPDNKREFLRARAFRACEADRSLPELRFLFDASDPRAKRKAIFSVDAARGEKITQHFEGDYLKNVRDEWATIVATPIDSPFPDSLAFTRSLGDFHMHAYGVSCEPSVCELSLKRIAQRALRIGSGGGGNQEESGDSDSNNSEPGVDCRDAPLEFMLIAASDGVWDNWKFDELFRFISASDEKRRSRARAKSSGDKSSKSSSAGAAKNEEIRGAESAAADAPDAYAVDSAVSALLTANLKRAQSIFGDDSDNMTAVLCHFRVSS